MAQNKRINFVMFLPDGRRSLKDALPGAFTAIKTHLAHFSYWIYPAIFLVILGAGAYARFWAAPLSAGVDVPQFWAFAKVFDAHGLDFYRYADASLDIFPVKGWGFVYPPFWLLISWLALAATPASLATDIMVDSGWRLAMKTPVIIADLAIGCLLYWAVPGAKWKKLLFAGLWLIHPTAWYNSAVFGQFDAIAAVLLLAAVIMLEKGNDKAAFIIAGVAVMTKQHVLLPVALMMAASVRRLGWRRILIDCGLLAGVVLVFSAPFLATGNFLEYGRAVILPGQAPDYQTPLMYAFNGISALLTYFNQEWGWETIGYLNINTPLLVAAFLAALVLCYRTALTATQAALIGFLIFIAFFYRVNYQYLVIYIPLALLAAAQTRYKLERSFAIIIAVLPAAWPWMFNVAFWFYYLKPANYPAAEIMERIGLAYQDLPDIGYVSLAITLTCFFIAHIILTFVKWRRPLKNTALLLEEPP